MTALRHRTIPTAGPRRLILARPGSTPQANRSPTPVLRATANGRPIAALPADRCRRVSSPRPAHSLIPLARRPIRTLDRAAMGRVIRIRLMRKVIRRQVRVRSAPLVPATTTRTRVPVRRPTHPPHRRPVAAVPAAHEPDWLRLQWLWFSWPAASAVLSVRT
jgi:hypothetical protein